MKVKYLVKQPLLVASILCLFTSCWYVEEPHEERFDTNYTPEYISRKELNESVKLEAPRPLKNTGKIFLRNPFLFVGEKGQGVHIINNADPRNPKNVAFLSIKGNVDVATKGNVLYADNLVDLVSLDISDVNNIHVLKRLENAFPDANLNIPPDGGNFTYDPNKGFIYAWKKKD